MHTDELIKGLNAIIPDGISIQDFVMVTNTDNITAKQVLDVFISNGAQIENVAEHLDWKDFEDLVAQILEIKGFDTIKNMILTKPRMEIDVIGTNHGITMLIDCKHWKKLSNSALNTIVLKQIERVKHYVTKTGEIIAVPVIVTLYQEQIQFINKVPIVPIQQFSSFIDEFYGNLDQMKSIEK